MDWKKFKGIVKNARKVQDKISNEVQHCVHVYATMNKKQVFSLKVKFINLNTGYYGAKSINIITGKIENVPNLKQMR